MTVPTFGFLIDIPAFPYLGPLTNIPCAPYGEPVVELYICKPIELEFPVGPCICNAPLLNVDPL